MSHPRRFLVPADALSSPVILLEGREARHLIRVLRAREGDSITLFDEKGNECPATVAQVDRKNGTATIHPSVRSIKPKIPPVEAHLHLGFAILKGAKNDHLIRTATHLGISTIHPFTTSRTVPRSRDGSQNSRMERWRRIAREAAKQSSGLKPPEIQTPADFETVLGRFQGFDSKIVFHERSSHPIREYVFSPGSCSVVIGPEGGFSDREAEQAESMGFAVLSLGPVVLRSELAAESALIIALYRLGRLG